MGSNIFTTAMEIGFVILLLILAWVIFAPVILPFIADVLEAYSWVLILIMVAAVFAFSQLAMNSRW